METIVTKSYQGAQTRLLLPKVKDVAGVIGDNNATRLCFKLPKTYATGWQKFVEFDCYVVRDGEEIKPTYVLDENNSILIPYEITESNVGKEVDYNLKLVSQDGEVVEKSEIGTLYFRDSSNGTFVDPDPYTDVVTFLYNNAFCNVSYSDGTSEGDDQLPKLTFTPMNSEGEAEEVSLNIPYLDENGYILNKFINKEIVVEVFRIATPGDLTSLTEAQVPDMALLSEWEPSEPGETEPSYYMDLYILVGPDPTVASNWYLIHTDNPTFKNISANGNVDIAGTLDVGGNVTIGNHTTGSPDTHATLTVNGDVHIDYDKKIFVDTIQSQTDNIPVTINDDVTLSQSKTLKVDRIESSSGGNDFPVTINDDLAVGTGSQVKNLKVFGTTNLQNTNVGFNNQTANLQVNGTLKTDTITSYNNDNPVTINDETVIGADGSEKSLYVYGTTESTDKITGNNGLEITSGDTHLKDTEIGDGNTASNLHVYGESTLDGQVTIDDNVTMVGTITLTGDIVQTGNITQTGNTDLSGTLKTDTITSHTQDSNISVNTGIDVAQNKTVTADTIHVDTIASRASGANDAVTIDDKLNITGNIQQTGDNVTTSLKSTTITGDIQQDGNNVSASLKSTTVTGTLGVSDQTTTNTLTVTNGSSLNTVTASGVVDLASTLKVDTVQSHTDDKPVTVDDRLEVGTSNGNRSFKVFGTGEVTGDTTIGGNATIAGDTTIGTVGSNNSLIVRGTVDAGSTTVTSLVTPSITGSNSNPVSITSGASISGNVSLPDYSSNSLLTTNSSSEVTAVGFGSTGYVLTGGGNSISWQEPTDDLTEQGGIHVASTGGLYTLQTTKAPNDHADTTMKYGHATPSKYGHVKFDQTVASNRQTYSPIGKFSTTSAYVGYYIEDVTQPSGYKLITESNKDSSGIDVNNTVAYLNDTSLMTISEEGIKDFVNSSIGTATANFLGTYIALEYRPNPEYMSFSSVDNYLNYYVLYNNVYTLVTDSNKSSLGITPGTTVAYTAPEDSLRFTQTEVDAMSDPFSVASQEISNRLGDPINYHVPSNPSPNDYVFVEMDFTNPTTSPDEYRRYKWGFDDVSSQYKWQYEYTLNNSSFTSAQWDAINSGITALRVSKLDGLPQYAPSIPAANSDIGRDRWPIKIVGGVPQEVAYELVTTASTEQTIAGHKIFTGATDIKNVLTVGSQTVNGSIEVYHATPFIDFHYNKSTADYTTRIIESSAGVLSLNTTDGTNSANLTLFGNQSTAHLRGSYRATPSADTEILTLGNGMSLSTDQTITAFKTFTKGITCKNTNVPSSSTVPSVNSQTRVIFNANDDSRIMTFDSWCYTGGTTSVNISNETTRNSLTPRPQISLNVSATGVGYIQALNQRTYNVSNISDIVTIGMLNDTSNVIVFKGTKYTEGNFYWRDPTNARNDTFSARTWMSPQLRMVDKNGAENARIQVMYDPSGKHELHLCAADSSGGEKTLVISSNGYATAPWRGTGNYASMGASEIITKGALQESTDVVHRTGDETIAGVKTLTNYIEGQAVRVFYNKYDGSLNSNYWRIIGRSNDTNVLGVFDVMVAANGANYGFGRIIVGNPSTSTWFCKWVYRYNSGFLNENTIQIAKDSTTGDMLIFARNPSFTGLVVNCVYQKRGGTYNGTWIDKVTSTTDYKLDGTDAGIESIIPGSDTSVGIYGAQTIIGNKTFTGEATFNYKFTVKQSNPWVHLVNNDITRGTTPSTNKNTNIRFEDKDGAVVSAITHNYFSDGDASVRIGVENTSGTGTSSELVVARTNSGDNFVRASYRAYASASSDDVLTKGHLESAITIGGQKTFTSAPIIKSGGNSTLNFNNTSNSTKAYIMYGESLDIFRISASSGYIDLNAPSGWTQSSYRPYTNAGNSDVLVKGHVADMMTANVSNHPVKLYSAQNNLISTTTLNQFTDQDIVLPASSVQYQNVTFGGSLPTTGTTAFTLQSTPDYANYPYRASYALTGVTADTYVSVTFSDAQVDSGNFASFAKTVNGYVYLYANADVGATTVPTISLGMDDTAAAGLATSALDGKVNKNTTAGVYAYGHNGSTETQFALNGSAVASTLPVRDANGRMTTANPVAQSTDTTVPNTNWISQTGDSSPNNLVHRTGNETIAGYKTFTSPIFRQFSAGGQNVITANNATGNEYIYRIYDINGKDRGYVNHQCITSGDLATRFIIAVQSPNYSTTDQTGSIASLQIELIANSGRLRITASSTKGDGTSASQSLVDITPS